MTSKDGRPYGSPTAFRMALTEKLRNLAKSEDRWPLRDLQRQFAYDRLLTRLYLWDDAWVLKGSTALLARRIAVRHTIDVDVYRAVSQEQAEKDLRAALLVDGGDWFTFEAGPGRRIVEGMGVTRVAINARLGTATWTKFHVDVVAEGIAMTGVPDSVSALTSIVMPGLTQTTYRAYPLQDHIADKTCAIVQVRGNLPRPSTRFKDLVDLVALTNHARPTATAQHSALLSEMRRRGLSLPEHFDVPDRGLWEKGYKAEADRSQLSNAHTLHEALQHVRPFVDPLLQGRAAGIWDPESRSWTQ
jgi:nucleotidyltransferase AbiEii toxin of type IV toxin-antitoxin system